MRCLTSLTRMVAYNLVLCFISRIGKKGRKQTFHGTYRAIHVSLFDPETTRLHMNLHVFAEVRDILHSLVSTNQIVSQARSRTGLKRMSTKAYHATAIGCLSHSGRAFKTGLDQFNTTEQTRVRNNKIYTRSGNLKRSTTRHTIQHSRAKT